VRAPRLNPDCSEAKRQSLVRLPRATIKATGGLMATYPGSLIAEKHEKDRRFRVGATYEGGEFLGAVARLDITDHTTPMKTANAPAMMVHSSDVK